MNFKSKIRSINKLPLSDKIVYIFMIVLLTGFVIFVAYPLLYVLIGSFMDPTQLQTEGISFKLSDYQIDGFRRIFRDDSILHGFKMSFFFSSTFMFLTVFICLTMAYPLSRRDFVGRKTISTLLIITMFFGGGLIPTFLLVRDLGMLDTVWSIIIPTSVNAWYIFLARAFFREMPADLQNAAELDGATDWQYFIKIVLPLSKPIIMVIALYSFVQQWNSYFDAMIYLRSRNLEPLQIVLRSILIQNEVPPGMISSQQAMAELQKIAELVKFSTIIVSSLPLLIMYPFFQKYFEKGMMIGAIKG